MSHYLTFTDKNFNDEVEKSETPVLVDFWSEWCSPCKIQTPIIEELAIEYAGRVKIGKIEVGKNPDTAVKYQIMSIPCLAVFKDGKMIESKTGLQKKDPLKEMIDKLL